MGSKFVSVPRKVLPALLCAIMALGLAAACNCSPYFALDTLPSWEEALGIEVKPMSPVEWDSYMLQWDAWHTEGDGYPDNDFFVADLYVYGGGGGGGLDPEDAGLVMVWGSDSMPAGSYSSAWKYDYGLDPDLTNAVINVTITAPQFGLLGNQVNAVSLGVQDVFGNIRSWMWNVGPGMPIQWNVPTQITLRPSVMGMAAAMPMASGFANNPAFNIAMSQVLIADENAQLVGGPILVPPPGQLQPRIWNYWSNLTVMPTTAQFDWGDAPDPTFPTLGASNGARHVIGNLMLGASIDPELDGQPDSTATGDDIAGIADEDGVVFTSPLIPGMPATVNVTASAPGGSLDAWIDFGGDGGWQPADRIFMAFPLPVGTNPLGFVVPATAVPGTTTFARFRLSTQGGLSPQGAAMDGEVEDYQTVISHPQQDESDWGDAMDPTFPTLAVSMGANHKIVPGMFLGASVDAERDGQPDSKAMGDDNNGDDEDGVQFPGQLIPGNNATIVVTPSQPGFLDAWLDFNSSGAWGDSAGEQICAATPVAGPTAITFPVPANSPAGKKVFARFRYSSAGGFAPTGMAPDGEVEDYLVPIGYKWVQEPDLKPTGIDINATKPYILADDFYCNVTGPLTDIHIWGSWFNDILPGQMPGNVIFRLSIHEDVPAGPGNEWSHPGEMKWYHEFQPGEFAVHRYAGDIDEGWMTPPSEWDPNGDHICWQYDFDISQFPFHQTGTEQERKIYWLDLQAEPGEPGTYFGWKTSLYHWNDDAVWGQGFEPFPGPWNELRYPIGHEFSGDSIDLAFAITGKADQPPQPGNLSVTYNKWIADHVWWPTADQENEMISLLVTADPTEAIMWNSIDLQAFGSGNDVLDIALVKIWLDADDDGMVGSTDILIGSGAYAVDEGLASIALTAPQLIPAGGSARVLISYVMAPVPSFGSTYQFDVTAAYGLGQTSGAVIAAAIAPTPLRSAKKIASTAPIKIGPAKKALAAGSFLLVDKEITADFLPPAWPVPWNWWYIEEPDRSAGIGVRGGLTGPLHIGDRVTVMGTTALVNGAELMLVPSYIEVTYHDPSVGVLGMNNRATGGAAFGLQPAVVDDAWRLPVWYSHGLNNVGMLVRTTGYVTGSGGVSLGGGNMVDVVWIDDGSDLRDGYFTTLGPRSEGIAVVVPTGTPVPPTGSLMVTGILRAIANPPGNPVRLLVPRDYATDVIQYP